MTTTKDILRRIGGGTARRHAKPAATPRVAIVGGGFAGIAAGVKLRKAGIDNFTIFERSLGIGGTWRDNTYPGCEVDTHSHLYSFSFTHPDWSRTHARQPELQKYLEGVVDEYDLRRHFRMGISVDEAVWDEATHTYRLRLGDGTVETCHVLISAVGFLNVPRYPDWPGLESFRGPKFHTARWEHEHDLTGKRVAFVGTGSTAAQAIPEIGEIAGRLLVFQREPGWVMPKGDRDFTPEEREALRGWLRWRLARLRQLRRIEKSLWRRAVYRPGSKINSSLEKMCRDYIAREFADRPDLREAVTPTYPYWGKRMILASTYYPALKRDNVELIPRAVTSITESGVVDADNVERPADVLVLSTGFQPTRYLAHLRVVGRGGRSLHDYWAGEPRAFLGITVPGFPNFFMLYGPGTNGGEIVWMLERQSEYAVRVIKRMMRSGVTSVEVKRRWADRYHRWLQSKMDGTAWAVSNNYFKSETGKIVTQWPYSPLAYSALTKTLGRWSESTRSRDDAARDGP
ncbi:MAG: NAD(P)/FAD-dependent oxidoreductase [Actinobacteria bacterium]|nr:MAG: NAD(P)/FAD-dependent oxidoreductase [Actinomycetota bacterium]